MQLVVLRLSHKTAPVEVRECFALSEERVCHGLQYLSECVEVDECVILSTCNRTEVYAVLDDDADAFALQAYMAGLADGVFPVSEYLRLDKEAKCIRHLMQVAAGLDSQVVGEGQILSQVKKAHSIAYNSGTTGTILNTLFNRAIATGKKVRTRTRIARNATSTSQAAVALAKKVFGDLSQAKVLILGAGKMSEITARHLFKNGVQTTFVANRNWDRARVLAEKFGGMAVPFESFMDSAMEADIVITSTGAPHYLIRARDVARLMPLRDGRPIIFIDIAVPRDVEPEVESISGVRLFNIDALEAVVTSNVSARAKEVQAAEVMIEEALDEMLTRFRYLAFRSTLTGLTSKVEHIRQRVVRHALAKLPDALPSERKVVEDMSRMLIRKILHDPIVNVTTAAGSGKEHFYLEAMRALFKLEEEETHRDNKNCNRHA